MRLLPAREEKSGYSNHSIIPTGLDLTPGDLAPSTTASFGGSGSNTNHRNVWVQPGREQVHQHWRCRLQLPGLQSGFRPSGSLRISTEVCCATAATRPLPPHAQRLHRTGTLPTGIITVQSSLHIQFPTTVSGAALQTAGSQ